MQRQAMITLVLGALALGAFGACGDDGGDSSVRGDAPKAGGSGGDELAPGDAVSAATAGAVVDVRKVIVNSTIRVEVAKLRAVYLEIGQITRSLGGFVAESTIDDEGGDDATATMRLRVPASRHDDLLAALRALGGGRVLKESTTAREVTEEYTDLQGRLRNLQRSEAQYQELLKQARTVDDVLNVQARLDTVRAQIEQTQGRLNLLDSLVDFATVSVVLQVPGAPAGEGIPGPREVFAEAWDDAVIVARLLLNLGVILLVAAMWLAIPTALAIIGMRLLARLRPRKQPQPEPGPPADGQ